MSRHCFDDSYTPELVMAFGMFLLLRELVLRVGRMPVPAFLDSDWRCKGSARRLMRLRKVCKTPAALREVGVRVRIVS